LPKSPPAGKSNPLAQKVVQGDRAAAARAISLIENEDEQAAGLLKQLYPATGRAHTVGVTGPPGVGKSTLVSALLEEAVKAGRRAGALLVDPSSPFSGGALLGDRLRLSSRAGTPDVFVRSLASRGAVGGLAASVWGARRVLEAMGLDWLVIETVGAGQSDVEIAACADTVAVVLMPGAGDEVQALKAGILEIADILVVNKADHPERDRALTALRAFVEKPLHPTVATTGEGVPALWRALGEHAKSLEGPEGLARRRKQAEAELLTHLRRRTSGELLPLVRQEAEKVFRRQTDPVTACEKLLSRWSGRRR
jgi:LAO/AO transport system kinase